VFTFIRYLLIYLFTCIRYFVTNWENPWNKEHTFLNMLHKTQQCFSQYWFLSSWHFTSPSSCEFSAQITPCEWEFCSVLVYCKHHIFCCWLSIARSDREQCPLSFYVRVKWGHNSKPGLRDLYFRSETLFIISMALWPSTHKQEEKQNAFQGRYAARWVQGAFTPDREHAIVFQSWPS
jgi:hypothetical protein